jgi:SET domain-containing protein
VVIHPHTELRFINPEMGFGVFATRFIPRGTLTWVRDELDQVVPADRIAALAPVYRALLEKYTFRDASGQYILCWDLGRFMNHSCVPSCLGLEADFEVAVRDIQPGEELTDDYGTLHLQAHEGFDCRCGATGCRGRVGAGDGAAQADAWEALWGPALGLLGQVPQPLGPVLENRAVAEPLPVFHAFGLCLPRLSTWTTVADEHP